MSSPFLCWCVPGNLAEIVALRPQVDSRAVKVDLKGYKYSANKPEPKLSTIMDVPFWKNPEYEGLRARLAKPVMQPQLVKGGEFISIDTRKGRVSKSQMAVVESDDEGKVHFPSLFFGKAPCCVLHACCIEINSLLPG